MCIITTHIYDCTHEHHFSTDLCKWCTAPPPGLTRIEIGERCAAATRRIKVSKWTDCNRCKMKKKAEQNEQLEDFVWVEEI